MRLELRFAVAETVSVAVCAAVAIAAWLHDPPVKRAWGASRPATMAQVIEADDLLEPATLPLPDAEEPATAAAEPAPAAAPKKSSIHRTSEPDPAKLDEAVARYAAALAGESDAAHARAPAGDIAMQIGEAKNRTAQATIGEGSEIALPPTDQVPRPGTQHETERPKGPDGPVRTVKQGETPKERIQIGRPKPLDDTTLTPQAVLDRIQDVYLRGLQRCYADLLGDEPGARGKVTLEMTVNEAGRLAEASADTEYGSLSTCIEKRMASWTFPIPRDGKGEPTEAAFGLTLALQPE